MGRDWEKVGWGGGGGSTQSTLEALREEPGGHVGRALLHEGRHAGLEGVDVELDLRLQQAPHVEEDAARAVDAGGVLPPVLVVLLVLDAAHLGTLLHQMLEIGNVQAQEVDTGCVCRWGGGGVVQSNQSSSGHLGHAAAIHTGRFAFPSSCLLGHTPALEMSERR